MSDTPRTGSFTRNTMYGGYVSHDEWTDFARTLERELNNQYEENVTRINAQALAENERDHLKAELAEAIRKNSYGCASEQDFVAFHNRQYELEQERDELKAEVERQANNNKLLLVNQEHEEQTREFLRCEAETLKAQVSEIINQRNQLLKEKQNTCPNCKEEVAFWADHIHSLPNQATSYSCFSSQQLKAEVERCNCVILQSTIDRQDMKLEANEAACEVSRLSRLAERLTREIEMLRMHPNLLRELADKLKEEREAWHAMAREAAHCCNEAAAYGTCDCDLENDPYPCVFCEANKVVAGFNDMEKGTK